MKVVRCFVWVLAAVLLLGSCSKEVLVDDGASLEVSGRPIVGCWEKVSCSYVLDGEVLDVVPRGDFLLEDYFSGVDFYSDGLVLSHQDAWSFVCNYVLEGEMLVVDEYVVRVLRLDEERLVFEEVALTVDGSNLPLVYVTDFHGKKVFFYDNSYDVKYYYPRGDRMVRCYPIPGGRGYYDAFQYDFVRKN